MSHHRPGILGRHGVVASPHPLATLAGIQILQQGGNAVDAAVATNAVLAVVHPHMCGLGGDLFALIWHAKEGRVLALNASGEAPRAASLERYRKAGYTEMPFRGLWSATVPGAVNGWAAALARCGSMDLKEVLQPAIHLAEAGFPTPTELAQAAKAERSLLEATPETARIYLPGGRPPGAGEILVQSDLARSLSALAEGGREAFYAGPVGAEIARASQAKGGLLTAEDLAGAQAEWVAPIAVPYRGLRVFQCPPNSQGIATLMALQILEGLDLAGASEADRLHVMVEAKKLAFADRDRFVSDPRFVSVPVDRLLDPAHAEARRGLLSPDRAMAGASEGQLDGDTICLCTADGQGNWVAWIQSLYSTFGSGVVAGSSGILLQNRGAYFSLDPEHVNRLAPGKRTLHTLTPLLAMREDRPVLVAGTRGADGQPQTLLTILTGLVDRGLPMQEALDAPRWVHGRRVRGDDPESLRIESRFAPEVASALAARGHRVIVTVPFDFNMGFAQGILRDPESDCLVGAADPRGDCLALGV
ncbi:MAG: gamma-glutamyltransferase [candidate division NC10 bacterium]|nr:gamma-glutamyltransferase [candidate division NC10 bacterium]MBI3121287.1 gamma-glutamyltransferase [candidate division NC10 bacterium]